MAFRVIVLGLLFAIVLIIIVKRCDNSSADELAYLKRKSAAVDSAKKADAISRADSILKRLQAKVASCPVTIVRQRLAENSLGNPEVYITLKNRSKKTVDGVKLEIACFNNFGEPVRFGYSNILNGISQDRLSPGSSTTKVWSLTMYEATTKVDCVVTEVHCTDGTQWSLN